MTSKNIFLEAIAIGTSLVTWTFVNGAMQFLILIPAVILAWLTFFRSIRKKPPKS